MNKLPFVFAGSIIVAVLITLFISSIFFDYTTPTTPVGIVNAGVFHSPRDVAVNSTGDIFVADTLNSRIKVFNPSGDFNFTFAFPDDNINDGSLNRPYGIHINGSNFIFVADTFTNVVKLFSPGGTYLTTIGTPGQAIDQFYYPSGMTSNNTHLFVADTLNHRIQILNVTGLNVDTIPSNATGP